MPDVVGHTESYCRECADLHPARYEEQTGRIYFTVDCPRGPRRTQVSSDSELFMHMRSFLPTGEVGALPFPPRNRAHSVEITSVCNGQCPICFANAAREGERFLPLERLWAIALRIRKDGGRTMLLTGGEPTLHPQLPKMVAMIRRMGLLPKLETNGLRLAEEPGFVRTLRAAGLEKVELQFDTFDPATYRILRGRDDPREKIRAMDAVTSAGLRLGLNVTVCNLNLPELGDILDLAMRRTPLLSTLAYHALVPGAHTPAGVESVDREQILRGLIGSARSCRLTPDDFLPLPECWPWGLAVHPDCSAHCFLCVDGWKGYPLPRVLHVRTLYEKLGEMSPHQGWKGLAGLMPYYHLLHAIEPGQRLDVWRRVRSLRSGRGRKNLMVIRVGSYMTADTRDELRMLRCPQCRIGPANGYESVCSRTCRVGDGA